MILRALLLLCALGLGCAGDAEEKPERSSSPRPPPLPSEFALYTSPDRSFEVMLPPNPKEKNGGKAVSGVLGEAFFTVIFSVDKEPKMPDEIFQLTKTAYKSKGWTIREEKKTKLIGRDALRLDMTTDTGTDTSIVVCPVDGGIYQLIAGSASEPLTEGFFASFKKL